MRIPPCVMVAVAVSSMGYAHAAEFEIHIPGKMMSDLEYEGLLTVPQPLDSDLVVNLATSAPQVKVPNHVILPAGYNHAMFPIFSDSLVDMQASIYGVTLEHTASAEASIFPYSHRPTSLRIAAPTDTGAVLTSMRSVPLQLYLVDSHGRPAVLDTDTVASISASSDITFSRQALPGQCAMLDCHPDNWFDPLIQLEIPAGRHAAGFNANIVSGGVVHALSDGLISDSISLEYRDDPVTVRVVVHPIPAAANTVGTYFVWLEKNGRIFVPDGMPPVKLVTSDKNHVKFSAGRPAGGHQGDHIQTRLHDGYATGEILFRTATDPRSPASVTAMVDGLGSGTAHVAISDMLQIPSYAAPAGRPDAGAPGGSEPTHDLPVASWSCIWVVPDVPSSVGWVTVGTYGRHGAIPGQGAPDCADSADALDSLHAGRDGMPAEFAVKPASLSGIMAQDSLQLGRAGQYRISASATGTGFIAGNTIISSDGSLRLEPHMPRHGTATSVTYPFAVLVNGDHRIAVLQGGMGAAADFESRTEFGGNNRVRLAPVPANLGEHGMVAFLYVTDGQTGAIIDALDNAEKESVLVTELGTSMDDIRVGGFWSGGVTAVHGTYSAETAVLQPLAQGTATDPVRLSVSGVPDAIELWMPGSFSYGAEFPMAVHAVDKDGKPISRIMARDLVFSDARFEGFDIDGRQRATAYLPQSGTISVISADGFIAESDYTVSINDSGTEVMVASDTPEFIRLGEEILLHVTTGSMPDPDVMLDSILAFEEAGSSGTYRASPAAEGEYTVTVIVEKDGWKPFTRTLRWNVDNMVDVGFLAVTDDDIRIPLAMDLISPDSTTSIGNGSTESMLAGVYIVEIPSRYSYAGEHHYTIEGLRLNDRPVRHAESFSQQIPSDAVFSATYKREISVTFDAFMESQELEAQTRISGTGPYRFGDTVLLAAPAVPELFGLVWHLPDGWSGLPDDAAISEGIVTFEATESRSGHVTYVKNYAVLIVLVLSGTAIPVLLIRARSPDAFLNISDMFSGLAASLRSKRKSGKREKNRRGRLARLFGPGEET